MNQGEGRGERMVPDKTAIHRRLLLHDVHTRREEKGAKRLSRRRRRRHIFGYL